MSSRRVLAASEEYGYPPEPGKHAALLRRGMEDDDPLREQFRDELEEEPEHDYEDVLQAQRRISRSYMDSSRRSMNSGFRANNQSAYLQEEEEEGHANHSPLLPSGGQGERMEHIMKHQTHQDHLDGEESEHDEPSPFYCPPVQRQLWGDEQVLPHIDWHDLFFDLLFVAMAYNLGHLLISSMNPHDWPRGVIYFVAIFGGLFAIWEHDTEYSARFTTVDHFHRIVAIARFLCVSAAVLSIKPLELLGDKESAETFVFTSSLFCESLIQLGENLELAWYGDGDRIAIQNQCFRETCWIVLPTNAVYLAAAVISGYHYFSSRKHHQLEKTKEEHNATETDEHEDGNGSSEEGEEEHSTAESEDHGDKNHTNATHANSTDAHEKDEELLPDEMEEIDDEALLPPALEEGDGKDDSNVTASPDRNSTSEGSAVPENNATELLDLNSTATDKAEDDGSQSDSITTTLDETNTTTTEDDGSEFPTTSPGKKKKKRTNTTTLADTVSDVLPDANAASLPNVNSTALADGLPDVLPGNIFGDNSSEGAKRFLSSPLAIPLLSTANSTYQPQRFLSGASASPYTESNYSTGVEWSIADVALILCFALYILKTLSSLYRRSTYKKKLHDVRLYFVPNNVDYMIHRYGEWVMLMIGESILSLLIVDTIEATDYYAIAIFGGLTVIMVQLLKYESEPHHAHEHALWRSLLVAEVYSILIQILSMGLVGFGVSYKLFLNDVLFTTKALYGEDEHHEDEHRKLAASYPLPTEDAESWLFCISLFSVLLSIEMMMAAHRGLKKTCHLFTMPDGSFNCGMFWITVLKVFLFCCTGTLGEWFTAPVYVTIVGFFIVSFYAIIQIIGLSFVDFEPYDPEASGKVVNKSNKLHKQVEPQPDNQQNTNVIKRHSIRERRKSTNNNMIKRHSVREKIQSQFGLHANDPFAVADDNNDYRVELDLTQRAYNTISKRNHELKAALLIARDKVRKLKDDKRELKKQLNVAHSRQSSTSTSDVIRSHELT